MSTQFSTPAPPVPIAFNRDQLALITRVIQQRQSAAYTQMVRAQQQRCQHMVSKLEAAADFCDGILQQIEEALQAQAPTGVVVFLTAGAELGGESLRV